MKRRLSLSFSALRPFYSRPHQCYRGATTLTARWYSTTGVVVAAISRGGRYYCPVPWTTSSWMMNNQSERRLQGTAAGMMNYRSECTRTRTPLRVFMTSSRSEASAADSGSRSNNVIRAKVMVNEYSDGDDLDSSSSSSSSSSSLFSSSEDDDVWVNERWMRRYKELEQFYQEHGHSKVPRRWKANPSLGHWVSTQRYHYNKTHDLFMERQQQQQQQGVDPLEYVRRVELLNRLNFVWRIGSKQIPWEERYEQLQQFWEEFGHANVPKGWSRNTSLANWVVQQRIKHKQGKLSQERIEALLQLGFVFQHWPRRAWDKWFSLLQQFQQKHGHVRITRANSAGVGGTIPNDTTKKEEEPTKVQPEEDDDDNHKEKKNDTMTTTTTTSSSSPVNTTSLGSSRSDRALYNWVTKQREHFKNGTLSSSRVQRLLSLGVEMDVYEELWEERFQELRRWHDQQQQQQQGQDDATTRRQLVGHNPVLAQWVSNQRQLYKAGTLSQERIDKLESIDGFAWEILVVKDFKERLEELVAFHDRFGHTNVPRAWKENPSLSNWVSKLRSKFQKGTLSQDRIDQVNNALNNNDDNSNNERSGFSWNIYKDRWEEGYQALSKYKAAFGDTNVPRTWQPNPQLASWVSGQRYEHRRGRLSADRMERLAQLDFSFSESRLESWDTRFEQLVEYHRVNGDCNVALSYSDNPQLAGWVLTQRAEYKRGTLSQERMERLNTLGFEWTRRPYRPMKDRLSDLTSYYHSNGHADLLTIQKEEPGITRWVQHQRKQWESGIVIPADTVDALNYMTGTDWQVRLTQLWRIRLLDLKKAQDNPRFDNGDDDDDKGKEGGRIRIHGLKHWISVQRLLRAKGKLEQDQIDDLNKHQFPWG